MSHDMTREEVQKLLQSTNLSPNPIRNDSGNPESPRESEHFTAADIEILESENPQSKKIKTGTDSAPQVCYPENTGIMVTDTTLVGQNQSLNSSPSGRSNENDHIDQVDQNSLQLREEMNYCSVGHPPIPYGPQRQDISVHTSARIQPMQEAEESDDSSREGETNSDVPSNNPYNLLKNNMELETEISNREKYTKKRTFKDAKEDVLKKQAEAKAIKLVKQAASTAANQDKLESRYAALDPEADITAALSQASISATPESQTIPVWLDYQLFHDIKCDLVVGTLRAHVKLATDQPNLMKLLTSAAELRKIKTLEDMRTLLRNHITTVSRFEVHFDPGCIRMDNTAGPQNDCGYRAEMQAAASMDNKTWAVVRELGLAPPDQVYKSTHLFPYLRGKASRKLHANSVDAAVDQRVIKVLSNDLLMLDSTLQYTMDRVACTTKQMGFIYTLLCKIGTDFQLLLSTLMCDEYEMKGDSITLSQEQQLSMKNPTLSQLRRMLKEGAIVAFVPSHTVERLEDMQGRGGTGHYSYLGSKFPDQADLWAGAVDNLASQVTAILLRSPELNHLSIMEKEQAYHALDFRAPPAHVGPPSSIIVMNFPSSISKDTPANKALVLSEMLYINDTQKLGLDPAQIAKQVGYWCWVGLFNQRQVATKEGTSDEDVTKGMIFPVPPEATGWEEGRFLECPGQARISQHGERSKPTEITTVYSVSQFATAHVSKVMQMKTLCSVRVGAGDREMNYVQRQALHSLFYHSYTKCKVILINYIMHHKEITRTPSTQGPKKWNSKTEFLAEVIILVILEEENDWHTKHGSVRHDLFGPTTRSTSIIKTSGGMEIELVQSGQVIRDHRPTPGTMGAKTVYCPHLRCLVAPEISFQTMASTLLFLQRHLIKGLIKIPPLLHAVEGPELYGEWMVMVSPLFTQDHADQVLGMLEQITDVFELHDLSPSIELQTIPDAFKVYPYYFLTPTQSQTTLQAPKGQGQTVKQPSRKKATGKPQQGGPPTSVIIGGKAPQAQVVTKKKRSGSPQTKITDHLGLRNPAPSPSTSSLNTSGVTTKEYNNLLNTMMVYVADKFEAEEEKRTQTLAPVIAQQSTQAQVLEEVKGSVMSVRQVLVENGAKQAIADAEARQREEARNEKDAETREIIALVAQKQQGTEMTLAAVLQMQAENSAQTRDLMRLYAAILPPPPIVDGALGQANQQPTASNQK